MGSRYAARTPVSPLCDSEERGEPPIPELVDDLVHDDVLGWGVARHDGDGLPLLEAGASDTPEITTLREGRRFGGELGSTCLLSVGLPRFASFTSCSLFTESGRSF